LEDIVRLIQAFQIACKLLDYAVGNPLALIGTRYNETFRARLNISYRELLCEKQYRDFLALEDVIRLFHGLLIACKMLDYVVGYPLALIGTLPQHVLQ
jgi:hypothetical protein